MTKSRSFVVLGLAIASVVYKPVVAQEESTVAEVGGHKITERELQEREGGKLLQARYKYYLAEREALDRLVEEELLETQAARESVSVDELLKRHVNVQLAEPTEDQLKFYYEGLGSDEPYDAVRSKILDTVHQVRFNKARAGYVNELRSQLGVVIELNQPSAQVDVAHAFSQGPQSAPVRLVEFADYECPYCQKVHLELKKLQEQMPNEVSLVYKDFPLPMHSQAEKAAEAGRCAGQQGKFWEFHDALFETKRLQIADLKELASTLKLDGSRFDHCLDSGEQAETVREDVKEGQHLGLTGTPSFFVNGHFLSGAISYSKLKQTVEQELAAPLTSKQSASLAPLKNAATK
jgi:protein-disulfide isomerase